MLLFPEWNCKNWMFMNVKTAFLVLKTIEDKRENGGKIMITWYILPFAVCLKRDALKSLHCR